MSNTFGKSFSGGERQAAARQNLVAPFAFACCARSVTSARSIIFSIFSLVLKWPLCEQ